MQKIGIYEIKQEIGRGGMGIVYLGFHPKLEREVAIKILPDALFEDDDLKRRFLQEARLSAGLNHENITTIYDLGEDANGRSFIVMEYLDGMNLRKYLKEYLPPNKPLPILEKLEIASQICKGFAFAHSRKIVHRDVKPENIMILKNKKIKILDFGIAKLLGDASINLTKGLIGSVNYMSPEVFEGQAIDTRSDIFSFGILLYEMITDRKPFKGTMATVMNQILYEPPPDIDIAKLKGLRGIKDIILKCLEKRPQDRYQVISEVANELEQIILDLRSREKRLQKLVTEIRGHLKNRAFEKATTLAKEGHTLDPENLEMTRLQAEITAEKERWEEEAKKLLSQAENFINAGRFQDCLDIVTDLLKYDPKSEKALMLRTQAEKGLADVEKSKAVEEKLNIAQKHLKKNDFESARAIVQALLKEHPQHPKASQLLQEIENQIKNLVEKKMSAARGFIQKEQYEKAINVLEELLAVLPHQSEATRLIGELRYRQQEQAKLVQARKKVTEKISTAQKLFKKKKYREASIILEAILVAQPDNTEAASLLEKVKAAVRELRKKEQPLPEEDVTQVFQVGDFDDTGDGPLPLKLSPNKSKGKRKALFLLLLFVGLIIAAVYLIQNKDLFLDPGISFQLSTDTPNAKLLLNSEPVGPLPQSFTFEPGELVNIRIDSPDHFPVDTIILISSSMNPELVFSLEPIATVSFSISPADAEVLLNGKRISAADWTNIKLPAGEHMIAIQKANYNVKSERFTLNKGINPLRTYQLERTARADIDIRGSVRIFSEPAGAAIWLDGREIDGFKTPHTIDQLTKGDYQIELRKEGFSTYYTSVSIVSNAGLEINSVLDSLQKSIPDTTEIIPSPVITDGEISILAKPFGSIFINDRQVGNNTRVRYRQSFPAEQYNIVVTHPSYGRWEKSLNLTAGGNIDILVDFNVFLDITVVAFDTDNNPLICDIYVDNLPQNKSTPKQLSLRMGTHKIAVQKAGYKLIGEPRVINLEKSLREPLRFVLRKSAN